MKHDIEQALLSIDGVNKILGEQLIQNLWSNYGQLCRVTLNDRSVIVKNIIFPNSSDHPKGWNSNFSHQRKVKSYLVETNWYKKFNINIENAYSPAYITSNGIDGSVYLILEDLSDYSFKPKDTISWDEVKRCIKWLANFHAAYIGVEPESLWNVGSYWNLEKRPDEYNLLDQQLKRVAPIIDEKLNNAKYQTIIHGDAKLANFLFNETSVSALDFQYVGGSIGLKDLIYFMTSVYSSDELFHYELKCLDFYFKELKSAISNYQHDLIFSSLEKEWRDLYKDAAFDFYRFLKGWSPTHNKHNTYSEYIIQEVLKCN